MKTVSRILAAGAIALSLFGCSNNTEKPAADSKTDGDKTVLKVGATTNPHAMILEEAKPLLADKGIELEIVEYSDYPNINPSTSDGSLDANYFQHFPYLESYDADKNFSSGDEGYLVSAGAVHYEPFGIYSDKHTLEDLADGAQIAVPNDATNEARALYLLQDQGWIKLSDDADIATATVADITDNPHNLDIVEIAADQIASKLPDVDYGVINGNYALTSGVTDKLLVTEAADSTAAKTYENVIAVRESRKDDEAIKTLVEVLKSDPIKEYIRKEFGEFAVPAN